MDLADIVIANQVIRSLRIVSTDETHRDNICKIFENGAKSRKSPLTFRFNSEVFFFGSFPQVKSSNGLQFIDEFELNDVVEVQDEVVPGRWNEGVVVAVNVDGTYYIRYTVH